MAARVCAAVEQQAAIEYASMPVAKCPTVFEMMSEPETEFESFPYNYLGNLGHSYSNASRTLCCIACSTLSHRLPINKFLILSTKQKWDTSASNATNQSNNFFL